MWNNRFKGNLGLLGATSFLGAFLLFQVQPIMGKTLLPWYGGGASVWIACLLFFQVALVIGYLYAHLLAQIQNPKQAIAIHVVLTFCAIASMPIMPSAAWKPVGVGDPVFGITKLLLAHIGVPYILLASTSPLMHDIFHRLHPDRSPYRLYALSNLGSLLALVAYPFLIEPFLSLRHQGSIWAGGLCLFVGLILSVSWWHWRNIPATVPIIENGSEHLAQTALRTPIRSLATWLLLAAIPSAMLMVTTTHVCMNIAPIPFVWIALLSVYLISFILSFDHPRWYTRRVFFPLFFVSVFVMTLLGSEQRSQFSSWLLIPVAAVSFFSVCMVMHGELARLKPFGKWITWYFLAISLGGAIGGICIALIAPWVFRARYDYPIVLGIAALAPFTVLWVHRSEVLNNRAMRIGFASVSGLASVFAFAVTAQMMEMTRESVVAKRNFYGSLRVVDEGSGEYRCLSLVDGVIDHGSQFLNPPKDRWVTTYYGNKAGIGIAFTSLRPRGGLRVGMIGLGVGAAAWYGIAGDEFDIVEINPDVVDVAKNQFSYLSRSAADIRVQLGDGRLAFEKLPSGAFDLIILDAFTSDSIPMHLLTKECFGLYFSRLKPDGLLCVNVSNRFLDLTPVVDGASRSFGWESWIVKDQGNLGIGLTGSTWVIVGNPGFPDGLKAARMAGREGHSKSKIWTDDHSSITGLFRLNVSLH